MACYTYLHSSHRHTSASSSGSLVARLPTLHHEPPVRQENQFTLGNVRQGYCKPYPQMANIVFQPPVRQGIKFLLGDVRKRLPESEPSPWGLCCPQSLVTNTNSPTHCKPGETVLYWE